MPSQQPPPGLPATIQLEQLTSLRGVACLVVLFGHATQVLYYKAVDYSVVVDAILTTCYAAVNAESAVRLFFVLSGCVLSRSLQRSGRLGLRAVLGFYVKRLFRIYPVLILSIPLAWWGTVTAASGVVEGVYANWLARNLTSPIGLRELLLSITGLYTHLNGPMWSLRVELIWSAAFPLVFTLIRAQQTRWIAVVALAGVALAPLPHEFGVSFGLSFALGAFIPFTRAPGLPAVFTAFAVGVLAFDRTWLGPWGLDERFLDCIETLGAFVIALDLYASGRRYRLLTHPALILVGEWSYGIYLLHLPILLLLYSVTAHVYGPSIILDAPVLSPLLLGLSTASLTVCISAACHRWWELPFQRLGRRLSHRLMSGPRIAASSQAIGSGKA